MLRIVHFEINVDDPERAVKFYQEVFGWKIKKWEGPMDYWLVTTGPDDQPGINGGIMKREDPQATTYNTVDVPSVDEFAKKIAQNGGKVVVPKMAVPGVGYMAYCTDTEGNVFGIMQEDPTAK
jgi:predicted enzyme related to lactoylglutathione lyase